MKLRVLRAILAVALLIGALYLSFEFGRLQSGYSLLDSRRQAEDLQNLLLERDQEIEDLQRQIAILQTSREIDEETYSAVEASLADLQAQIQAQEEDIAFYRGIAAPADGVAGLRIQNVEVGPDGAEYTHVLSVLLVQAIVQNDRVTGSVRATVRGDLDGEPVELALNELGSEGGATDIPYGFRYFQELDIGISLPEGLIPSEIEIQVWPRSPRGETIVQSLPWEEVTG